MDEHAAQASANGFLPHGTCIAWNPALLSMHVVSDALITLAYFSIPLLLIYLVRKRGDVPFTPVFWMFGVFIVACDTTHLLGIITVWQPWYWLSGIVKVITAAASVGTALLMLPLLPKALALKSSLELDHINQRLQEVIAMYERERKVAGELQRAFLPVKLPDMPGMNFDAAYEAGVAESDIGGDWYDAFPLADGRVAISIGDVAGRGLHAAVTMGKVRQSFRVCALQDFDTAQAMRFAEKMLELYDPNSMVTAFFAVYDPLSRNLSWSNAGHPPPIVATADGKTTMLTGDSAPLGVGTSPKANSMKLELGSMLVLYTDGLIESRHQIVEDTQRLVDAVKQLARQRPEEPAETIRNAMLDGPAKDDVAILVLSVLANASDPIDITLPAVPESLRGARMILRRFALAAGCGEERTRALETAAGEDIINAIEHAYGVKTGSVRIVAHADESNIAVSVEDRGTWRAPRREGRGRGIEIMKKLSSEFRLETEPEGKRVYLTMPIAEPNWQ